MVDEERANAETIQSIEYILQNKMDTVTVRVSSGSRCLMSKPYLMSHSNYIIP